MEEYKPKLNSNARFVTEIPNLKIVRSGLLQALIQINTSLQNHRTIYYHNEALCQSIMMLLLMSEYLCGHDQDSVILDSG